MRGGSEGRWEGGGLVRGEVAYVDAPPRLIHTTQGACSMRCHVVSWKIGCSAFWIQVPVESSFDSNALMILVLP